MIIAGLFDIINTNGLSNYVKFTAYRGTQQSGTPYDFTGKTAILEVKDPKRNRVVKTYTCSISGNEIIWNVAEIDIEPGQYIHRVVIVSPGRKDIYVTGKFIVNV